MHSLLSLFCCAALSTAVCAADELFEFDAGLAYPCYPVNTTEARRDAQETRVKTTVVLSGYYCATVFVSRIDYCLRLPDDIALLDYAPKTGPAAENSPSVVASTYDRSRALRYSLGSDQLYTLEGGREFTLELLVPQGWNAGLLDVECVAYSRAAEELVRTPLSVGLYMAGNAKAHAWIRRAAERRTEELANEGANPVADEYALTDVRQAARPILFMNAATMQFRYADRTRFARDGEIKNGKTILYTVGQVTPREAAIWNPIVGATQTVDRSKVELTDAATGDTFTLTRGQTGYLDHAEIELTRRSDGAPSVLTTTDSVPLADGERQAILTHIDLAGKNCTFDVDGTLYELALE
jgi:hypothetical protein